MSWRQLGETARRLDETQQVVQSEKATREAAEMCVMLMRKDVEHTQQASTTLRSAPSLVACRSSSSALCLVCLLPVCVQAAEQAVASARNEAEMRLRDLQEQAIAAIQASKHTASLLSFPALSLSLNGSEHPALPLMLTCRSASRSTSRRCRG